MPSSTFIDRDQVVMKLIKYRCKLAERQAERDQKNEFISRQSLNNRGGKLNDELCECFPPRKCWCGIGRERQRLDTLARNEKRLRCTYLKAKRKRCKEQWYVKLCQKADKIVELVYGKRRGIAPPKVTVIEKKRVRKNDVECIVCRPVCSFPLNLKIIFSLLNKYLT